MNFKKPAFALTFAMLFSALPALADIQQFLQVLQSQPAFQVTSTTTSNSAIEVQGSIAGDGDPADQIRWIWFQITKDGESPDPNSGVMLANDGSAIDQTIYLRSGPGNYTLKVLLNPDAQEYSGGQYYAAQTISVTNTDTRDATLLPSPHVQSDSSQIVALANQITSGLQTNLEKARAVHDWVAKHIAYDQVMLKAIDDGQDVAVSALSTLQSGKSVCEGYADLVAALNRAAGVPTRVITGIGAPELDGRFEGPHAWNQFLSDDGSWIDEDATWDAGGIDVDTNQFNFQYSTQYFDGDSSLFAKTHLQPKVSSD